MRHVLIQACVPYSDKMIGAMLVVAYSFVILIVWAFYISETTGDTNDGAVSDIHFVEIEACFVMKSEKTFAVGFATR